MIAPAVWRLPRLVRELKQDQASCAPDPVEPPTASCRVTTIRVDAERLSTDLERELRRILGLGRLDDGSLGRPNG